MGIGFLVWEGEDEKWDGNVLYTWRAAQGPGPPSQPPHISGQVLASWPWPSRGSSGPARCRLRPPGDARGPQRNLCPARPQPAERLSAAFPPLHSHLINSLPSFSQIYQHLAFARSHTQPQPLSPPEEQRQRDSFLKGLRSWKKEAPDIVGGAGTRTALFYLTL